jgi:cytosine/adenosine deaminase-related metal-dependent hydrolase
MTSSDNRRSLVRGRHILLRALDDETVDILDDGGILQVDGQIQEVGPFAELASRHQDATVVGSPDHIVVPGLVNAHHHIGMTPVQLGSPDMPLELWLTHHLRHRDVDPYLDTLYSAFELVASGVTAVQHLGGMKPGPVRAWPANASEIIKAYVDLGMRVSFAFCNRDQHRLVYGDDASFVASLPEGLQDDASAFLKRTHFALEDYETEYLQPMIERYGNGKERLVRVWLAPINLERSSDKLLTLTRDWARKYGIGIHLHLSETPYQKEFSSRRFGKTSIEHLEELDFLGPHLTVGHGNWLCESDLDIVAKHGVCVCHNASSNLRLRSGIAPVREMVARGIPVAIGIDEAGLNDDRDMLQEMRLVRHLHARPGIYEKPISATQIFRMATEHGANAIGFGDEIGTLEVGKQADLVLLDYARITSPFTDPAISVVEALIYRAKTEHVTAVMIDGHVVYQNGRFSNVDRNRVLKDLAADLNRPLRSDEIARGEFSRAVFPHVRDFYRDWRLPPTKPFYDLNGRE